MHTTQQEFIQLTVLMAVGTGLTGTNPVRYLNQLLRQNQWSEETDVVKLTVAFQPQLNSIRVHVDAIERTITYWISINIDTLAVEFDVS